MYFVGFRHIDLLRKLWLPTLWGFKYRLRKQLNFFWNVPDYSLVVYIMVQVCTYIRWTPWQHTLWSRWNFRVDANSHILALPTFNQRFDPPSDWALPYTIFAWTQNPKRDWVPILWRWRDSSSPQMDVDTHAQRRHGHRVRSRFVPQYNMLFRHLHRFQFITNSHWDVIKTCPSQDCCL